VFAFLMLARGIHAMSDPRGMTRRSLLAAGAAAAAGAASERLVRPGGAAAALSPPAGPAGVAEPVCFERWVGGLSSQRPATVDLGRNADLVGVEWPAASGAGGLELRVERPDGSFSPWVAAGGHGHGPDQSAPSARLTGDPVWTGGGRTLELRAGRALGGVRLKLVDVSSGRGARAEALAAGPLAAEAALPLATPALPAGAGQPPIIARRAWAQGVSHPRVAPEYGAVEMAFVHHTENPNGYTPGEVPAMLRAIYAFHRYGNGWNDIGYNFVLDLFGRIFEARAGGIDEPVVGAQAGGYNLVSTGVAVLGSFSEVPISIAASRSLERLLAWKLSLHGVSAAGRVTVRVNPAGARYSRFPAGAHVSLAHISGHRDGDSTDCPGDVLYSELPRIRRSVLRLAGRPARVTLALGAGQSAQAAVLTGALTRLDGTPIAGAPVEIQMRSVSAKGEVVLEQTLAQAVTGANGEWSVPVSIAPGGREGIWLRALCPGGAGVPAAVSLPLNVPGAASLTPQSAPAPTPEAAAPPAS
jgi:N-acetylmuramoyl-L-alanine amidase